MSWPTVKLGEIFEIARGGSPRPIQDYITDDPDGLNWISISDASESSKYIESTARRIKPSGLSKTRVVKPGDLLLTNSMSFGRPYIMRTSGCIHDGWLVLSDRSGRTDPDFMYHLLGSDFIYKEFERLAAGATVKNLNIELVSSVKFRLPSLEEQRRIAAILDQADALRAKRRAALAKLDTLAQSIFIEMFGEWDRPGSNQRTLELGTRIDFLTSGSRGWAEYYSETGALFLRIQNVRDDELDLSDVAYVQAPDTAEAKRTRVQAGDVLLSITADLGRTAVVPAGLGEAFINQHLAIIRSGALNPRFLSAALRSPAGQRAILRRNREAVKAGLNFDDVRSVTLPDISLARQDQFAARAAEVDALKHPVRASEASLASLFASLQHRAFAGELTAPVNIASAAAS
ncbi:MAG: restriction endonuclease subunit S [Hyphomonadaceae bacterium]